MVQCKQTIAAVAMTLALSPNVSHAGEVSWYGPGFDGQRTASGLIYNKHDTRMAAHKTLPLGTMLKVTGRKGGSLTVYVVDRGPYHGGRVLDVSEAAASPLGLRGPGHANLRIQVVGYNPHYKHLFKSHM
jgi:rare lipoprotein A